MRTPFSRAPRAPPSRSAVPTLTGADLSYWQGWLLKCQKAGLELCPHPRTADRGKGLDEGSASLLSELPTVPGLTFFLQQLFLLQLWWPSQAKNKTIVTTGRG